MPHEIINSTATALKPVDATQFSGSGSNFQKIVDEWTGGTNTDFFVAKIKSTAINTDMGVANTIGEAGQTTFQGIGSALTGISSGSGDLLATLEQRVNNEQSNVGATGSNEGILKAHVKAPWALVISGTITAGANSVTLTNTNGLINIEPNNSYMIQDAAATASGKQEIIKIASVDNTTPAAPVITITGTFANSYAANAYVSPSTGTTAGNSLQPNVSAVSTHAAYTKNVSIDHEMVEPVTDGTVNVSWKIGEKWCYVATIPNNNTLTFAGDANDAAMLPQYYEGTTPFKIILIKVDKNGDKIISKKSTALSGKNFMVFELSAASTHNAGVVSVNLNSANPVYGTSEATETFIKDGSAQLKWMILPYSITKECSATDQETIETWIETTLTKVILGVGDARLFLDEFGRADGAIGNNYTEANVWTGGSYTKGIVSGSYRAYIFSTGGVSATYYQPGTYSPDRDIYVKYDYFNYQNGANNKTSQIDISVLTNPADVTASAPAGYPQFDRFNTGVSVRLKLIRGSAGSIGVYVGSTNESTASCFFVDQAWYTLELWFKFSSSTAGVVLYKNYAQGGSAASWTTLGTFTGATTTTRYIAFNILSVSAEINGISQTNIDNYSYGYLGNGVLLRGTADITGTANKLSLKTTIWSKSRAASIPAELSSQAILV
jgi:hypothetical protein